MYTKVTQKELAEVLDYYRQDRKNCLYSYIDLKNMAWAIRTCRCILTAALLQIKDMLILCRLKRCTIF